MIPDKSKIEEIIKELQKIMRIQDWDIEVVLISDEEYFKKYNKHDQAHNEITRVLNSSYIEINKGLTMNWYQSLIHELAHLVFDHIEQAGINAYNLSNRNAAKCIDDNYTVALERTVDRVANIILTLYPLTNFIKE